MRYGLCMNMVADDEKGLGISRIPQAAELGFDYVELPLAQIMELSDGDFSSGPLRALSEAGISCACCNNFFPSSIRLTGQHVNMDAVLTYARAALARAARLGAGKVVFGSSGARNVPDGFSIKEGLAQLETLLGLLAPIAEENGIVIVIEPLNRLESNVINSLYEGLELSRKVGHRAVASLVDFYHARMSGDAAASVRDSAGLLRHIHFARVLGRSMPVSETEDEYIPFLRELSVIGYDETISIEAFAANDFMPRTAHALDLLKRMWGLC